MQSRLMAFCHDNMTCIADVRRPDEVSKIGGLPVYLSIQVKGLEKSVAWIPRVIACAGRPHQALTRRCPRVWLGRTREPRLAELRRAR
jgi:hypothetical protein